jgi:glycosyltransferase involved in cell wall biosynthesis
MRVSGLIITKNNGMTLEWALASVYKYLDEIIIIDDYSTDNTAKIAEKYGAIVYLHKFEDFSAQRNYGISKCAGEWIFTMDADEVMGENIEQAFQYLKSDRYRAFLFPRYNMISLDPIVIINSPSHYSEWQVRMFLNDGKCYYTGKVHHQLQKCKPRLKIPNINIFHFHFLLYDYDKRKEREEYYESFGKEQGHRDCYLFEDFPHTYLRGIEKIKPEVMARVVSNIHMVNYEYMIDEKKQISFKRNIKVKEYITRLRFFLGI